MHYRSRLHHHLLVLISASLLIPALTEVSSTPKTPAAEKLDLKNEPSGEKVETTTTALVIRAKRQWGGFGCCGMMMPMCCPLPLPPPMPCCLPAIPPPVMSCCSCCMPVCVPMCMSRCMMGCGYGFGRRKRAAIAAKNISYPLLK